MLIENRLCRALQIGRVIYQRGRIRLVHNHQIRLIAIPNFVRNAFCRI